MKKRIAVMLLTGLLILSMAGGGCGKEGKTPEEMKELAQEYLNLNYNDTFTAKGYSPVSWAYPYASLRFASQKYPDEVVEVRIYEEDGSVSLKDNYFRYAMKEDAEEAFGEIVAEYESDAVIKVSFVEQTLPDGLPPQADFKTYAAMGECRLDLYIITDAELGEEIQQMILKKVQEEKIQGNVRFLVVDDLQLFGESSISDIVNEQYDHVLSQKDYSI